MDSESNVTEVRVLNSLIVSTLDNLDEYRRAVFMAEQQLAALQRKIFVRTHAVERMQRHVRALGGQPASSRSSLATAFASLLGDRFLSREQDQEQLLSDIARGEQRLKRQFETSGRAALLSDATRTVMSSVHQSIATERVESDRVENQRVDGQAGRGETQDASWNPTLPTSIAPTSMHAISIPG